MNLTETRSFIHNTVYPATVVYSASVASKRKLKETTETTFSELLLPFGGPFNLQAESETRRMAIENFNLRFVDVGDCSPLSPEVRDQRALASLQLRHPSDSTTTTTTTTTTKTTTVRSTEGVSSSIQTIPQWLERWLISFMSNSHFYAYESIDAPIARVLVVCTGDSDVLSTCEQLSAAFDGLPVDVQVPTVVLYLHDAAPRHAQGLQTAIDAAVAALSVKYPEGVVAWGVHSGSDLVGVPEIQQGLFNVGVGSRVCRNLMWSDVAELQKLGELCATVGCRWAFSRFEQLDAIIAKKKRGFTNTLKSFWKPRASATASSGSEVFSSLEWQIRVAADLAFHLRFYEAASELYKSVVGDFKTEQRFSEAASCLEMAGLATFLQGAPLFDFNKASDAAIEQHLRAGNKEGVFKSTLLFCVFQKNPLDAAQRLDAIATHTGLAAGATRAVIHELVASFFARASNFRKAAFQQILAGHLYREAGLRAWALECYSRVRSSTTHSGFAHITDHVCFSLAKQLFAAGDQRGCLEAFRELFRLPAPSRTPDKQFNYFKGLLSVAKTGVVFDSPVIIASGNVVSCAFNICTSSVAIGETTTLELVITNHLPNFALDVRDVVVHLTSGPVLFDVGGPVGPLEAVSTQASIVFDQPGTFRPSSVSFRLAEAVPCVQTLEASPEIHVHWVTFSLTGVPPDPVPVGAVLEVHGGGLVAPAVGDDTRIRVSNKKLDFDESGVGHHLVEASTQLSVNFEAKNAARSLVHKERRDFAVHAEPGPEIRDLAVYGYSVNSRILCAVVQNSSPSLTVGLDRAASAAFLSDQSRIEDVNLTLTTLDSSSIVTVESGGFCQVLFGLDRGSENPVSRWPMMRKHCELETTRRTLRGDDAPSDGVEAKMHLYVPWTTRTSLPGFTSASETVSAISSSTELVVDCPQVVKVGEFFTIKYIVNLGSLDTLVSVAPKNDLQIFGKVRLRGQGTLTLRFIGYAKEPGVFELPDVEVGRKFLRANQLVFVR